MSSFHGGKFWKEARGYKTLSRSQEFITSRGLEKSTSPYITSKFVKDTI